MDNYNKYNDPTLPGYKPDKNNNNYNKNNANFLTFTDEQYGIQINYPSNWKYSRGVSRYMIVSFNPPPSPNLSSMQDLIALISEEIKNKDEEGAERKIYSHLQGASVALYSFSSFEKSLETFVNDEISEIEQEIPNFEIVSSRLRTLTDEKINGYEIIYTGTLSGADKKKILTIWITNDGKIYQITYLSNYQTYPYYLSIVNMMIDSFTFL